MSIVENIKLLCEEVEKEAGHLKTLAGNAGQAWWGNLDPDKVKLKQMARIQADIVVAKAQALRDAIPD